MYLKKDDILKRSLLSLLIASMLVACGSEERVLAPVLPPTVEPELPDIGVDDPIIVSALSVDGHLMLSGSIECNGGPANQFDVPQKEDVVCMVQGRTLATFTTPYVAEQTRSRAVNVEVLSLAQADEYKASPVRLSNIQTLIKNIGSTQGNTIELDLSSSRDALTFEHYFDHNLDMPVDEFRALITEKVSNDNQVDKQPSTHVPDVAPAVTPGASSDLTSGFVSASAEESLVYKPSEVILTQAQLLNEQGLPVNGIAYFSTHGRGVTGVDKQGKIIGDGRFEFSWGENISFAIDTFELGEIRGNKTAFHLTELAQGNEGKNVEKLVHRYADRTASDVTLPQKVTEIFALYPNVVNEAISLSLNSDDTLLDVGEVKRKWFRVNLNCNLLMVSRQISINSLPNYLLVQPLRCQ